MSVPNTGISNDQPHIISLVVQSKKAFQHGQQLCSKANTLSNLSAQCAIDVLALDAKVKWISEAVIEQLKLAANVARSIEQKRAQVARRVQDWDTEKVQRQHALDDILDSLGSQVVPPDFHQSSSESSLFGSPDEDDPDKGPFSVSPTQPHQSPTSTLRSIPVKSHADRSKWKTLRDFVDEKAIEDALETMEKDRGILDDILGTTDDFPETLKTTVLNIRNELPELRPISFIESVISEQETTSTMMARHLESLTAHYDEMTSALRESEAGNMFAEEDLREMNRDIEELPSIITELEEGMMSMESTHEQLVSAEAAAREELSGHRNVIDSLDELAEIMEEMLHRQDNVEVECEAYLSDIRHHLLTLEDLHHRYHSYQNSFNKLLVEIARRRQYREAAENIVRRMMAQLEEMTEEERQVREDFRAEHGAYLPEDICLCIENPPTKWEVVPWSGDAVESLPDIDGDLLTQAQDRINNAESILPGNESL